jgi:hypothetical protein
MVFVFSLGCQAVLEVVLAVVVSMEITVEMFPRIMLTFLLLLLWYYWPCTKPIMQTT